MATNPKAEVEISAHSRGLEGKLRDARAKFGKFGAELKKNIFGKDLVEHGFWSKGGAQLVGNLGASALGGVASFLTSMARDAMHFDDALVRLQINGGATAEEIADFGKRARAASNETGLAAQDVLAAGAKYVDMTGDIKGASVAIAQWARIAQASNSTTQDVAAVAAEMQTNFGVRPEQMEAAFSALIIQGKEAKLTLADMGQQMSKILPLGQQFAGGAGLDGIRELGSVLQVVGKGAPNAEEATTQLRELQASLLKTAHAKHLAAAGVKVFDEHGHARNFLQVLREIAANKLLQDPRRLQKALGEIRAFQAVLSFKQHSGGTGSIDNLLDDMLAKSQDASVVQRDLATYTASSAGKLAVAGERLKNAIIEAFTPERIQQFADIIAAAMNRVKGFMDWVDAHSNIDKDPNFRSNDANEIVDRLKANFRKGHGREMTGGELGDLAVQMQNIDVNTGAGMPEQLKHLGGNAHSFVGMREAGDVLGRESGAISGGMRVRLADNVSATNEYFTGMGVRSPNVGPDPWAAMGGASGKMDPAEFARTLAKENAAALAPLIARLTGQPIEVKVDSAKIVDAHRNSRAHSTRNGQ